MGQWARRRRAERQPHASSKKPLIRGNRRAGGVSLEKLLWPEPASVCGNQGKPRLAPAMLSEPGEQLDEAKLAKGCRLKPEDNLVVVRMAGKRGVAFFELRCGLARPEARAQ